MSLRKIAYLLYLGPHRAAAVVSHLPNFLKLFWRLLRDPRVSLAPKLLLVLVAAYVLFPVDLRRCPELSCR